MGLTKNIIDRLYSFKGIQLRSNIIGSTYRGLAGVNPNQLAISGVNNRGATTMMNGSRLMSEYYRISDELQDYEITEISTLILTAYKDFLTSYFSEDKDLIISKNPTNNLDTKLQKVNEILLELDIKKDIKEHLNDILYWGSYCSLLKWNSMERKFYKVPLVNSNNVVTVFKNQKVLNHLVMDREHNLCEVSPYSLIRYGQLDLDLINNIREEDTENRPDDTKKSGVIVKEYNYSIASPLYYQIVPKIKEYILNEQLMSLLNIKDLIQPLLLLVNCDKNTDVSMATSLANNLENLINKYSDISTIFSARFSINDLMDSVINNVRVVTDYNGTAGNLGTLDLSKLKEKIDALRNDQDNRKENIVNSLSLTMDFLQGRITKWDAVKQSERLNSRINSIVQSLNSSVLQIASNIYYLLYKEELNLEKIKSNLFTKTATQYNTEISNAEIINNLIEAINRITGSALDLIKQNQLVDPMRYFKYIKSKLLLIDSEAYNLLTEERFMEVINQLKQDSESDYGR